MRYRRMYGRMRYKCGTDAMLVTSAGMTKESDFSRMNTIPQDTPEKQCTWCKAWKTATSDHFYFSHARKGAIDPRCIQCQKERYALKHPPKPSREGMKQCSRCEQFLPATTDYFHAHTMRKSGLYSMCKECRSTSRTQHRHDNIESYRTYEKSRQEEIRQARNRYRVSHREELRQKGREYGMLHEDHLRVYRKAHSGRHKLYLREYAKTHPDEHRVHKHKRRALMLGNGGTHTQSDIRKQYTSQKGKCYYCKKRVGKMYHVDHVIPLARGGSNGLENLVIACPACNMSKHAKIIRLL